MGSLETVAPQLGEGAHRQGGEAWVSMMGAGTGGEGYEGLPFGPGAQLSLFSVFLNSASLEFGK